MMNPLWCVQIRNPYSAHECKKPIRTKVGRRARSVHHRHLYRACARRVGDAGGMVRVAAHAFVESSIVAFRARMDGALPHDGDRSVACLASRRMADSEAAARVLRPSACAECCLVASFLRTENARPSVRRNPAPACRHHPYRSGLFPRLTPGLAAPGALHRVGVIRLASEFHPVAAELVSRVIFLSSSRSIIAA